MLSNYPPGVTGREWQIAGAEREFDARRRCSDCGEDSEVTVYVCDGVESWDCPVEECGAQNEYEPDYEREYDEDRADDERRGMR